MTSHTVSIRIERPPQDVADFVSNPENLPAWGHGLSKSVTRSGADWIVQTMQGPMTVRFVPRNDYGVLDHYLTGAGGEQIHVPMRVLPNGAGSELIFTILKQPGMSDAELARDIDLVQQDFRRLKALLEQVLIP